MGKEERRAGRWGSGLLEVELGWLVGRKRGAGGGTSTGLEEAAKIPGHHGPGCRETGLRPAAHTLVRTGGGPRLPAGHGPPWRDPATWPRRSGGGWCPSSSPQGHGGWQERLPRPVVMAEFRSFKVGAVGGGPGRWALRTGQVCSVSVCDVWREGSPDPGGPVCL